MTLAAFLEHWSLVENPFKGEEARQDPVFARLSSIPEPGVGTRAVAGLPKPGSRVQHPDFEKIAGDFSRPSAGIVFGEKGSGKTAMRLQISEHLAAYNSANPAARVLLVPYDNLNEMLDRVHARVLPTLRDKKAGPGDTLKRLTLSDHIDGIMAAAVPRLVDALLEQTPRPAEPAAQIDPGPMKGEVKRGLRGLDLPLRLDMLVLQAVYDRPVGAEERTLTLRRKLGIRRPVYGYIELALASLGWLVPASVLGAYWYSGQREMWQDPIWSTAFFMTLGLWVLFLLKRIITGRLIIGVAAKRLRRQLRAIDRSDDSLAASIRELPATLRSHQILPLSRSDDARYGMLERLRRVLAPFGYAGLVVIVDRVDEPTLVSGDPERMRSVVWPMLNNKFLQQDGLGVKLLLPIDLRHLLFRESNAFFQEARLDKQNLVERLAWTGPMLYDLCTARLNACRPAGASPMALTSLFAEDVSRGDLIDALDQIHHPRDAFKLLYQCVSEHCSNATSDSPDYRVSKAVLDMSRKQQAERLRQLYMGVRPA